MRGWFLVVIILDHLTYFPNGFAFMTGDSRLIVTAAEGFFIISGLVLGLVRGAKLRDKPLMSAAKLIWKRAGALYLTSIIATVLALLISWQFVGNPGVKMPLPDAHTDLFVLGWQIITLQQFYGWADYLRLYALFLAVAPAALWLLRRGWWYVVLAISGAVWAVAPRPVSELNQPLTWQLLFFMAFVLGYYLPEVAQVWRSRPISWRHRVKLGVIGLFVVTLALNVYAVFVAPGLNGDLNHAIVTMYAEIAKQLSKLDLPPGRIALAWLWFAGFYIIFRRYEDSIVRWCGWLLLAFGRNSLYVYTLHAFVVLGLHLVFAPDYYTTDVYITSFNRLGEIPGNAALSIGAVLLIYCAVKRKFLMKIIPR